MYIYYYQFNKRLRKYNITLLCSGIKKINKMSKMSITPSKNKFIVLQPAREYIKNEEFMKDHIFRLRNNSNLRSTFHSSNHQKSLQSMLSFSSARQSSNKKIQIIQVPTPVKKVSKGNKLCISLHSKQSNTSDLQILPDVFNLSSSSMNNEISTIKIKENGTKNDSMISKNYEEYARTILNNERKNNIEQKNVYVTANEDYIRPRKQNHSTINRETTLLSKTKKEFRLKNESNLPLVQFLINRNHLKEKYLKFVEDKLNVLRQNYIVNNISERRGNREILRRSYNPLNV